MTIIELLYAAVKNGGDLDEAIEAIVPGADLVYWQRRLNGYNPDAPAKKRKPAKRRQSATTKRKRSTRPTLESACNWALVETVKRANGDGDA